MAERKATLRISVPALGTETKKLTNFAQALERVNKAMGNAKGGMGISAFVSGVGGGRRGGGGRRIGGGRGETVLKKLTKESKGSHSEIQRLTRALGYATTGVEILSKRGGAGFGRLVSAAAMTGKRIAWIGVVLGTLVIAFKSVQAAARLAFWVVRTGAKLAAFAIMTPIKLVWRLAKMMPTVGKAIVRGIVAPFQLLKDRVIPAVSHRVQQFLKGMQPASFMQDMHLMFEVLLKSGKKAGERLKWLSRMATVTPFTIEQITAAAQKMEAFGAFSKRNFLAATSTAAVFQQEIMEVVNALGMLKGGRPGHAFRSLARVGITRRSLKPHGIKFAKSGELLTDVDKTFDTIIRVMEARSGKLLEVLRLHFSTVFANIKDEYFKLKDIMGKPIIVGITTAMNTVVRSIRIVQTLMKNMGGKTEFADLAASIASAGEELLRFIETGGIGKLTVQAVDMGKEMAAKFAEHLSTTKDMFKTAISELREFLQDPNTWEPMKQAIANAKDRAITYVSTEGPKAAVKLAFWRVALSIKGWMMWWEYLRKPMEDIYLPPPSRNFTETKKNAAKVVEKTGELVGEATGKAKEAISKGRAEFESRMQRSKYVRLRNELALLTHDTERKLPSTWKWEKWSDTVIRTPVPGGTEKSYSPERAAERAAIKAEMAKIAMEERVWAMLPFMLDAARQVTEGGGTTPSERGFVRDVERLEKALSGGFGLSPEEMKKLLGIDFNLINEAAKAFVNFFAAEAAKNTTPAGAVAGGN